MKIYRAQATDLCTVVVDHFPERVLCAKPAVLSLRKSDEAPVFHECAEHALASDVAALDAAPAPRAHPPTKSKAPYLLVRDDAIVAYAWSLSAAVHKRADKLSAVIVPRVEK